MIQEIELAATAEGKITAVRVRLVVGDGRVPAARDARDPAARCLDLRRAATTSRATASSARASSRTRRRPTRTAVRAGRRRRTRSSGPIDALARKLGMDPVELRRLNFIREFPATIASGPHDRLGRLRRLARQGARAARLRGGPRRAGRASANAATRSGSASGFSTYVEMCGLAPSAILGAIRYVAGGWDAATIRCLPTGTVQVLTGTSPHGQGHETSWSQIVADQLGYEIDEIEVLHGDTTRRPARDGHVRQPQPRRRRRRALPRSAEDRREGEEDRRAPARRRRGELDLRRRHVHNGRRRR